MLGELEARALYIHQLEEQEQELRGTVDELLFYQKMKLDEGEEELNQKRRMLELKLNL